MAEEYSVKAVLSAKDNGFKSGIKAAQSSLSSLKSTVTSGIGFGILSGIGQAAFSTISSGVTGIISDMNEATATWKTFNSNMTMNGKSKKQIEKTRTSLQKYAQQTIYSSSDMASTYAQLDAVGTRHTTKLVKGFGGLASAAENPAQAMKTLSQQATQMAAKPTVQWQDFKLMVEQTPAGIAAVAKTMGRSTQQLIKDVQDGKIATQDFFNAVSKTGTNKAFTKMATEYKTIGQAMDGLKETVSNKLQPAFITLSSVGISAISKISDNLESIDGEKIAKKVQSFIDKATPYWESFAEHAKTVGTAFSDAGSAIGDSLSKIQGATGKSGLDSFNSVLDTATGALTTFAGFLEEHADVIAQIINHLPQLVAGYMAFKGVKAIAPGVMSFGSAVAKLAAPAIGTIASKLFGISAAQKSVGKSSSTNITEMLTSAKSFVMMAAGALLLAAAFALIAKSAVAVASAGPAAIAVFFGMVAAVAALGAGMAILMNTMTATPKKMQAASVAMLAMGAAVLLVSVGFAIMAQSAISVASAGPAAIAVMIGMVAAIAGLAAGAAVLGTALTAGAVGFLAFGAAIVLVGVGALVAAAALAVISGTLPQVAAYGLTGAAAIAALGASMIVFAAGAALAGAACIILAAGIVVLGAGVVIASAGIVVFAAAMLAGAAGVIVFGAAVSGVAGSMSSISSSASSAASSITIMMSSISIVKSGLSGLGALASSAMNSIISAFDNTAGKAQSAGTAIGQGFKTGLNVQLIASVTVSRTASHTAAVALASGKSSAYRSGVYIGQGFANGIRSMLSTVRAAAAELAAQADKAIQAKAKIGSPSRVTKKDGRWVGIGFGNGIISTLAYVKDASERLFTVPQSAAGSMGMSVGGSSVNELADDCNYDGNGTYVIYIPVDIDGREVAKATATYTKSELETLNKRENRKRGKS